jgi:hypothetical protein
MKTPPMAGVWTKYANRNCEMPSLPFVAMMKTVLAIVISSGSHSAFVWIAIHGRASRSGRTWIGRIDSLNASLNPTRPTGAVDLVPDEADEEVRPGARRRSPFGDVARLVGRGGGSVAATRLGALSPLGAGHGLSWVVSGCGAHRRPTSVSAG